VDTPGPTVERELDGTLTEYFDVDVRGDRVERLLTELLTEHWRGLSVGPLIQGAVFEVRFTAPPRVTMLDGYMTVDPGAWHFHLCVNDHREAPPELAAIRRVGRAAFFRTRGTGAAGHAPMTWGLRLWNGRSEQMVTVLFPSAYYSNAMEPLPEPDWRRVALWDAFRARYGAARVPGRS
jgi:hypothetical protein